MELTNAVVGWLLLVILSASGAYGMWQSFNAAQLTARTLHGVAKYKYQPKWYQRVWYFVGSFILLSIGLVGIGLRIGRHS